MARRGALCALTAGAFFYGCHAEAPRPTGLRPTSPSPPVEDASARSGEPALADLALAASPTRIVVASDRGKVPVAWSWVTPRDGCYRLFVRAHDLTSPTATSALTFGAFTVEGVERDVLTPLPQDGPFCAQKGTPWALGFNASAGSLEWVIVGNPEKTP